MSYKLSLNLAAVPTVAGLMVAMPLTGLASTASTNTKIPSAKTVSCDVPSAAQHTRQQTKSAADDVSVADFSEAESDAAVTLFGCDCSSCIRALRQLRSQTLLSSVQLNAQQPQGHCWSSMQQRVSNSEVQEVLEALDGNVPPPKP